MCYIISAFIEWRANRRKIKAWNKQVVEETGIENDGGGLVGDQKTTEQPNHTETATEPIVEGEIQRAPVIEDEVTRAINAQIESQTNPNLPIWNQFKRPSRSKKEQGHKARGGQKKKSEENRKRLQKPRNALPEPAGRSLETIADNSRENGNTGMVAKSSSGRVNTGSVAKGSSEQEDIEMVVIGQNGEETFIKWQPILSQRQE